MPQVRTPFTRLAVANGETLAWGVRTYVMGIINVTPDSFSGDGLGGDVSAVVDQALRFQEEELARLMPTLEAVVRQVELPISVDTYKAEVAKRAVDAGAVIINDIWGLKPGAELAQVAAETGAGLVLMHNKKGTIYQNLLPDVVSSLQTSVGTALDAGVPKENIVVDPGIGFGKTPEQNLEILAGLDALKAADCPIMVGTSRKSTLGLLLDLPADQRVEATAATVSLAIAGGADLIRVHDVKEMVRVCRVTDAVVRGWRPEGWKSS